MYYDNGNGTWLVGQETPLQVVGTDEIENYKTWYWASETYDAYQIEAYGPYYSTGASYYELYGQQ